MYDFNGIAKIGDRCWQAGNYVYTVTGLKNFQSNKYLIFRNKYIMIGGVIFGIVLVSGYITLKRRKSSRFKLPQDISWRPIGTLKKILIFPMKSGGYVEIDESDCTELGITKLPTPGLFTLRDRQLVLYRLDTKEMVYSSTYPHLTSIKISAISENTILFKCQDKHNLEVTIPTIDDKKIIKAKMWTGETMDILDCGETAADWITELIKGDKNAEGKLRIGYWVQTNKKQGNNENFDFRGAYQNYTSYMMMTSASLKDVCRKIPEHSIDFKQFRPNFLIDTTLEPFAEDNWSWIKIGEDEGAIFAKIKDCGRCSQINIDPETHRFNKKGEPLATLRKYRTVDNKVLMGICLGLYKSGKVKVGDNVYLPF